MGGVGWDRLIFATIFRLQTSSPISQHKCQERKEPVSPACPASSLLGRGPPIPIKTGPAATRRVLRSPLIPPPTGPAMPPSSPSAARNRAPPSSPLPPAPSCRWVSLGPRVSSLLKPKDPTPIGMKGSVPLMLRVSRHPKKLLHSAFVFFCRGSYLDHCTTPAFPEVPPGLRPQPLVDTPPPLGVASDRKSHGPHSPTATLVAVPGAVPLSLSPNEAGSPVLRRRALLRPPPPQGEGPALGLS